MCSITHNLIQLYSVDHILLSFSINIINPLFKILHLIFLNLLEQGLFVYFLPEAFHRKNENCKLKKIRT